MKTGGVIMKFTTAIVALLTSACAVQPATLDPGSPAETYTIETSGTNFQIDSLTSTAHEVAYGKEDIIARAQACVGRTFSYGDVRAQGSNAPLLGTYQQSVSVGGGQLIEVADPAHGILVANNRVNYNRAMIPYSAQARVTVEAKDKKFRLVLANPELLQKSTGYAPTDSFHPMNKIWGTGWDRGVSELAASANKLANCIKAPRADW
jgi:hypothetical protein